MSHLLDDDELTARPERELTLSTSSILGIFLGLTLLCGLFFGLGYNLGSHKKPPIDASEAQTSIPATNFNSFKPSAGLPAVTSPNAAPPVSGNEPTTVTATSHTPDSADRHQEEVSSGATMIRGVSAAVSHPVAPASTPSIASATGSFVVQVAAVSHQEDAELMVNALKSRGYPVAARSEPQDKLQHIQVGPFNNRKDAEAMRQRLLGDGYNALIK